MGLGINNNIYNGKISNLAKTFNNMDKMSEKDPAITINKMSRMQKAKEEDLER